ncbi:MAG: hypothetical protein QXD62_03610, partial [Candidatus Woesearchaeota archaeon]
MKTYLVWITLFLILLSFPVFSIQQSHPASEIEPGVFGADLYVGNYTFPDSLSVSRDLSVGLRIGVGTSTPREAIEVVGSIGLSGSNPARIGTIDSIGLSIVTANTSRILISSTGNVGIGTTSPSYRLDVSGTLRTTQDTYLATSSGNVGIGTTTANDKLEVAGNVRAVQFIDRDNTNYYLDPSNTGTSLRVAGNIRVDG